MTKTKNIEQTVVFSAKPHEVYGALMDSKKHAKFTGGRASVSRAVGGKFTAFDGYITGFNLELKKDKKIIQAWTCTEWPVGHYSVVTFSLKPVQQGTQLVFTHIGVPANKAASISSGWKEYYWKPMEKMFGGK